jgi:predicted MPP superfamily phosphohydrolase
MSSRWRARLGVFGVFGNHDTPHFQRACRAKIPGVRWTGGEVVDVAVGGSVLRLAGMDWPEDPLSLAMKFGAMGGGSPLLTLAHHPTSLIGASTIGLPILLAGHTHAGQVRLHPRAAPHTSSDLPPHLATGVLRLGNTLCCISRGLGDGVVEGLRVNCPRQMPLYTLRHGPLGGKGGNAVEHLLAW